MENPWKRLSNINPQRENGHREISNEVYTALIKAELTGGEYKISLAIIEKTWGFNKPSDVISCSQFITMTGLSERMVKLVIKSLKEKKMVYYQPSKIRVQYGSPLNEYLFNKHYDTWVFKGCNTVHGVQQNVKKGAIERKRRVKYSSPTKETITKETIQKKTVIPSAPDFISSETWNFFIEHRKSKKSPLTSRACQLIFIKLEKWKAEKGINPDDVLNRSIENGWTGIFEPDKKSKERSYFDD